MKEKLQGILFITTLIALVLVIIIVNWKEILAAFGAVIMAVVAVVIFGVIVSLIGTGFRGDKWD